MSLFSKNTLIHISERFLFSTELSFNVFFFSTNSQGHLKDLCQQ